MTRRRQRGFTLTELMIVVAILGVLATLAAIYMRPKVKSIDAANRVGDLVREASRRAVAQGPVRADVAVALGSKGRTELRASVAGTTVTFTLYALAENATLATGTWNPVTSYVLDKSVTADSWSTMLGARAAVTPLTTSYSTFSMKCYPDGTCDSRSLFFVATSQDSVPPQDVYAKLAVMPLGGAIVTRKDWN